MGPHWSQEIHNAFRPDLVVRVREVPAERRNGQLPRDMIVVTLRYQLNSECRRHGTRGGEDARKGEMRDSLVTPFLDQGHHNQTALSGESSADHPGGVSSQPCNRFVGEAQTMVDLEVWLDVVVE